MEGDTAPDTESGAHRRGVKRTFRRMLPTDLSVVAGIEARAHAHPRPLSVFTEELLLPHAVLEVLEIDGQLVGFMDYWSIAGELELHDIAIEPSWQGGGHGRALLGQLLNAARTTGASRVLLEVAESNTAARKLYESEGFVPVGRRARYYPDGQAAILYDWS